MHGNENKALYCGVFEWTISILKKHNSNVYNVLIYEWKFYHFHFAGRRGSERKKVYEKKADEMWVWEETMGIKMLHDEKLFCTDSCSNVAKIRWTVFYDLGQHHRLVIYFYIFCPWINYLMWELITMRSFNSNKQHHNAIIKESLMLLRLL